MSESLVRESRRVRAVLCRRSESLRVLASVVALAIGDVFVWVPRFSRCALVP